MSLFFRVSGIVAVLALFCGFGYAVGERKVVVAGERFQRIDVATAFDTKLGLVCRSTKPAIHAGSENSEHVPPPPPGLVLDTPYQPEPPQCSELAKQ